MKLKQSTNTLWSLSTLLHPPYQALFLLPLWLNKAAVAPQDFVDLLSKEIMLW